MRKLLLLLFGVMIVFGAEDPWSRVTKLESGVELRIYKRGSAQPILAKMGEASDENLVVIVKNEQTAIAKEDIDRVEYRPEQAGGRFVKESKTTTSQTDPSSTSTSSGLVVRSKPDFETIYRRPPAAQKK